MTEEKKKKKFIILRIKFPRIYRFITEAPVIKHLKKYQKRLILSGFISILIFLGIIIVSIDTYRNMQKKTQLEKEKENILNQIEIWKSISEEYKGYRDAYFQLALLEYQLKNYIRANEYLQKTLSLDPNYKEGRELEKLLDKSQ